MIETAATILVYALLGVIAVTSAAVIADAWLKGRAAYRRIAEEMRRDA